MESVRIRVQTRDAGAHPCHGRGGAGEDVLAREELAHAPPCGETSLHRQSHPRRQQHRPKHRVPVPVATRQQFWRRFYGH